MCRTYGSAMLRSIRASTDFGCSGRTVARRCRRDDDSCVAFLRTRFVPTLLVTLTILIELAAVPLSWGLEPMWDTLLLAASCIATTVAGALILTRHPRHAIGWLLIAQGLLAALGGDLAQGWG